jgi:hypothetical protein
MTPISTGYQPEFGLGALYQGFNAANADRLNEEEVLKHFLQNQKDIREAPLNQIIKQWEAKQAEGKMGDPEYLAKMLEGYKGQMNSQIAAGNKGMRTWESAAASDNQENKNKEFIGGLLEQFNKGRMGQTPEQPQGGIGFNMQPPEQVSPIGNISKESDMIKSFGSDYRNAPDMPSANYMINEINRGLANPNIKPKDKQDLLKEKQRILAELNGQPPVLSNMMQQPQEAPTQEAPVNPQNNVLAQLQNVLVNTPEHLQKMEQLNTKGDYSLEGIRLRNEAMLANAKSRASQIVKDPKYTDIVAKAILIDADPDATPEEKAKAARIIQLYTRIEVVKRSAGQVPGLNLAGTQETGKPVMGTTPAREFMENPEMLTGDSTRRKEAQAQRGVATGRVSSGKTYKMEKTDE